MLRDKRPWYVPGGKLWHAVEIADRNCAIFERKRREERLNEAMLRNQPLGNDPEYLCPDLTDSVNPPVLGLIERLVCGWVDSCIL